VKNIQEVKKMSLKIKTKNIKGKSFWIFQDCHLKCNITKRQRDGKENFS
jgi:hypothetical protein